MELTSHNVFGGGSGQVGDVMGERCGLRIYAGDGEESSWQTSFCKILRKRTLEK